MLTSQYIRNPLAKAIMQKMTERQMGITVCVWYELNSSALSNNLQEKFFQSTFDKETERFLDGCYEKSDWMFTQLFHAVVKSLLQFFISFTTINGLLGRGSMFVFSNEQLLKLLDFSSDTKRSNLLDIGAGDGKVTKVMAPYFSHVYATETSTTMRWKLAESGYEVLGIDEWQQGSYKVISLLNVLDRVDQPRKLLKDLWKSLDRENGLLLLAIVLPYKPCVEKAGSFVDATEVLPIVGNTPEEQLNSIVDDVFEPAGFEVVRFTKLPYLCEGDINKDFFVLDDYVFTLKVKEVLFNKEKDSNLLL